MRIDTEHIHNKNFPVEKKTLLQPSQSITAVLIFLFSFLMIFPWNVFGESVSRTGIIEQNPALKVGDKAPSFSGQDLNGKKISLDDYKGRPIFLDFSSIFCKSCQEVIREFKHLEEVYKETDLVLMIISADGIAALPTLKNYFEQVGALYPVVVDRDFEISQKYGVSIIPAQFLIDRKGILKKMHIGFVPKLDVLIGVRDLLKPLPDER